MRADEIVAAARGWIGTPYRHRAATRGAGCDCLGLLVGVMRELGHAPPELPHYGADWRDAEGREALAVLCGHWLRAVPGPEAGQVALFRLGRSEVPRHCGLLVTADRFVHAQEGFGVVEANLTEGWRRRLAGTFEVRGFVRSQA